MDAFVLTILMLVVLAFLCETLDASMGMGYGTILSPLLVVLGYDVRVVVPAILISQAVGGISASFFHHREGNVDLSLGSKDVEAFFLIAGGGVLASVLAAKVSLGLSKEVVKTYIGCLVVVMGLLVMAKTRFKFSRCGIVLVGLLSAFNKGLSGGGYGPVVTGGQMIAGNGSRSSVGVTTMAEPPICIVGFLAYLFMGSHIDWWLAGALSVGAVYAGPWAARATASMGEGRLVRVVGLLMVLLGLGTLLRVCNS